MAGIGSRKQIKLVDETPVLTDGEWEPGITVLLNTWAEVKLKSASKVNQYNQLQFDKFFEFRFRWVDNIEVNVNTKVVYHGNRYAVLSIEREKEKNFYWILKAEAKAFV